MTYELRGYHDQCRRTYYRAYNHVYRAFYLLVCIPAHYIHRFWLPLRKIQVHSHVQKVSSAWFRRLTHHQLCHPFGWHNYCLGVLI